MGADAPAVDETRFGAVFRGGSGSPLLLLHSGLCTWMEWRTALPYLTGEHEVIAPTRPGSHGGAELDLRGRSFLEAQTDYVEELLDDAGWSGPVAVAGSSHGGVIGLELAARGRAHTVIALAPPWLDRRAMLTYFPVFALGGLTARATAPLYGRTAFLRRFASTMFGGPGAPPLAMSDEDIVATLRSAAGFPLHRMGRGPTLLRPRELPDFERIDAPVTIAWGTRDRLAPHSMSRRWLGAMPHAEFVELPGFPHVPHLRDPERVAKLIGERTGLALVS